MIPEVALLAASLVAAAGLAVGLASPGWPRRRTRGRRPVSPPSSRPRRAAPRPGRHRLRRPPAPPQEIDHDLKTAAPQARARAENEGGEDDD